MTILPPEGTVNRWCFRPPLSRRPSPDCVRRRVLGGAAHGAVPRPLLFWAPTVRALSAAGGPQAGGWSKRQVGPIFTEGAVYTPATWGRPWASLWGLCGLRSGPQAPQPGAPSPAFAAAL